MLAARGLTFIDVELANPSRASICEIGIIRIEDGREAFRGKFLIDPEAPFDRMNIRIHGITPSMVSGCPKFPEVWHEIERYMTSGVIIAHNASSVELCAFSAALERYGLPIADFYYICTLQLARAWIDSPDGYSLGALCNLMGIELTDHHDALADAQASIEIFEYINRVHEVGDADVSAYHYAGSSRKATFSDSRADKALNELAGLVYGIGGDNVITSEELVALDEWIQDNSDLDDDPQVAKCLEVLSGALEDRYITAIEYAQLLGVARPVERSRMFTEATLAMQLLFGILEGIACDNVINEHELDTLVEWLKKHMHLTGVYPFDSILATVTDILKDGIITTVESDALIATIRRFTAPLESASCGCEEEKVCISGKCFCLTGSFNHGEKSDVGKVIEAVGGVVVTSVSKKTDFLVVGGIGSTEWKFGNYGSKVSKALELKEKGVPIVIFSEADFFKLLGEDIEETAIS